MRLTNQFGKLHEKQVESKEKLKRIVEENERLLKE
jgi:hypothetical protein